MLELVDRRNRDFARRCKEIMELNHAPESLSSLAAKAAASAAPCYYVSYDMAVRTVREYRRGELGTISPLRRSMWEEISRKVASFEARGYGYHRAVETVLRTATASSFFISPVTARHIAAKI
ncbi:MAG: hypothetical protein K2K68_01960 [Duncaniella sp.]|nr:hypothetical protein [Duncaniella sp.]